MERKTIPFYFCKSKVPLAVFRLRNGKKYVAVIDTGSEVSMFDPDLKDDGLDTIENGDETSFVGVNGESGTVSIVHVSDELDFKTKDGEIISVPIAGILYDMKELTSVFQRKFNKDIVISAILGSDFLKEYNAKIDFKNKTLTIDA